MGKPLAGEDFRNRLVRLLAILMSLLAFYTGFFGTTAPGIPHEINLRAWHLALAVTMAYLLRPVSMPKTGIWAVPQWALNVLFGVGGLASFGYLAINYFQTSLREGSWFGYEYWLGFVGMVTILEACRRMSGPTIPLVCLAAIAYAAMGHVIPGLLGHAPYSVSRIISYVYLGWDGFFGVVMGAFCTYILPFMLFGAFLKHSGAGKVFSDIALAALGRQRGGPAKAAVLASALFGTISGSSVANVAGTGSFTIPLMTEHKFMPEFAAAVVAVAATGGQIMPPVMGSCAFILAEMLEVTYARVCMVAAIPAIMYYFSIYCLVDLRASKRGLAPMKASEVPRLSDIVRRGWYLLLPLPILVTMIFMQFSPMFSSAVTCVLIVVVSYIGKENRMTLSRVLKAFEEGGRNAVSVAVDSGCLGIVSGLIMMTGLGGTMASTLVELSRGNLGVLLVLTMCTSIIMGMGLPVVACYVILAVMVVPALVQMGLQPIIAHLFVMYFASFAHITPPVAVASQAAASLAKANYMKVGWSAVKMGLVGFLMPFAFVYDPAVAAVGTVPAIVLGFCRCGFAVVLLAMAIEGWAYCAIPLVERILLGAAVYLLLDPGLTTTVIGGLLGLLIIAHNRFSARRRTETGMHEARATSM